MTRTITVVAAALLVCVLAGCAGLLMLVSSALAMGNLYGEVKDLFGNDPSAYALYMDGYNTGLQPGTDWKINLTGVPIGEHVFTLATSDMRTGFSKNLEVNADQSFDLGKITTFRGAVLTGKVQQEVGGVPLPLAGVRVAAVLNDANVLASNQPPIELPAGSGRTVIVGFTKSDGTFTLGPASYGQWIVTSAYPGRYADAAVVTVDASHDASGLSLVLKPDATAAAPATVRGTVRQQSGNSAVNGALIATTLVSSFSPNIDPVHAPLLATQLGGGTREQPWFAWRTVATQTAASGGFDFEVPPGAQAVYAFKYSLRAEYIELNLVAGSSQAGLDFTLPPLN